MIFPYFDAQKSDFKVVLNTFYALVLRFAAKMCFTLARYPMILRFALLIALVSRETFTFYAARLAEKRSKANKIGKKSSER